MLIQNKYIFLVFGVFLTLSVFSQTKKQLKDQKSSIEKEISYTTNLLNKTRANKNESLNYLRVLDKQISNKESLLKNLNIEISLLSKQIRKTERSIIETRQLILNEKQELILLKREYAKMIFTCFKEKGHRNDLIFIVSAKDFNQAYKRLVYLKQYASFRKNQIDKIIESQKNLAIKEDALIKNNNQLVLESASKRNLIVAKKQELNSINETKKEKQELVNGLNKSEKLFKIQLKHKQKRANDLNEEIRKIIADEIRKAREEAEKKNKGFALTPEAIALSSEFNNNKGKLPWPLEKGVIIQGYGKQKHAVLAGIETFNNGIDIVTDENMNIRAVFEGTVSRIFFIKGEGKAILLNHGKYFSVYSGLKEVSVKVGDKVLAKEILGVVFTQEKEEKTELHFEIWKGYDKQDPSKWLFKAY
ncbi:MAG: peptidoglycan DD-metalloendopeptidase family protein [Flavobacteriales bacterium]|jgi:murein hydrolase activator|nr:peptidoglycan DD-metalloendopeptidase family protein [Flavobacteriales bacterium]MBT5750860.1 peptidoglycan DD-metalloendopeptidase family protein [Flavobacteriales bacterium]